MNTGTTEIFPKGERITNNNFTGNVWLNILVESDTKLDLSDVRYSSISLTKNSPVPTFVSLTLMLYFEYKNKELNLIHHARFLSETVWCL